MEFRNNQTLCQVFRNGFIGGVASRASLLCGAVIERRSCLREWRYDGRTRPPPRLPSSPYNSIASETLYSLLGVYWQRHYALL